MATGAQWKAWVNELVEAEGSGHGTLAARMVLNRMLEAMVGLPGRMPPRRATCVARTRGRSTSSPR